MATITKFELTQRVQALSAQNAELRRKVSDLETQLAASQAELKGLKSSLDSNTPDGRKAVLDRARALVEQGHYVVVQGGQLKDFGPRRH